MSNQDKIVVITGATDGVGKQTALQLAQAGYHIVMMVRNKSRAEQTCAEVKQATGNKNIHYILVDLSSLAQVRNAAKEFNAKYPKLDILINNAGLMIPEKRITADGFEQAFEVNHLAPFLLTHLLLDKIKLSTQGRIINLSSEGHRMAKFDSGNFNTEKSYGMWQQYCFTKLCNLYFTYQLADRLKDTHITVNAVHPGVVKSSFAGELNSGWRKPLFFFSRLFMIDVEQGAATSVYAATSPKLDKITGQYFQKSRQSKSNRLSHNQKNREILWEYSMEKCGLN